MKEEIIVTLKDTTIYFTGEQLIQSDLDVWLALVHLVRNHPLGSDCTISGHAILKVLNRPKGKSQRDWLLASMLRLSRCSITVKRKHFMFVGHIIDSLSSDDRLFVVRLNKDLIKLYGFSEWTELDWAQRMRLIKQPLAQWLHAFLCTHAMPYPIHVETLRSLCGSNIGELRNFKIHLKSAFDTLVEIAFLDSYTLEPTKHGGDLASVKRPRGSPPPATA
jgi:hypothetical protein